MKPTEQKRFDTLCEQHLRELKLRGYSASTIDVYSRAVRSLATYYDCVPDQLSVAQLEVYFAALIDSQHAGKGAPALKYLSRYLYRAVISEKNIVANHNGQMTFKYLDSNTGQTRYRILTGEDFLWRVLQHVLPKGFRRVRDYGFLHGNAKQLLVRIQLTLRVKITARAARSRPLFSCPKCRSPMRILGFIRPAWASG